jgi:transcription initiation factor TFIID TATA-box-binding protein
LSGILKIGKDKNDKKATVSIENVVASAILNQRISLFDIVNAFDNVDYRPEQFPGLVFRLKKPQTATLIFSSGKMVCTGSKSEKSAIKAIHKVVNELKKKKIVIHGKPEITIQNIVASASLPSRVDIDRTAALLERTMYEPEQFPGLIYRMTEPKVVMLIFASGKLVCTGAKHESQVYEAVDKLYKQLQDNGLLYEAE